MAKRKKTGSVVRRSSFVVRKKRGIRKGTKRKAAAKKAAVKKAAGIESTMEKVGEVTHYFPHVNAAAVKMLKSGLKIGDEVYIKGHTSDFREVVESMQLDHVPITEGKRGQEIGLLVKSRVRIGDGVYRAKK
jgi:putative protease